MLICFNSISLTNLGAATDNKSSTRPGTKEGSSRVALELCNTLHLYQQPSIKPANSLHKCLLLSESLSLQAGVTADGEAWRTPEKRLIW